MFMASRRTRRFLVALPGFLTGLFALAGFFFMQDETLETRSTWRLFFFIGTALAIASIVAFVKTPERTQKRRRIDAEDPIPCQASWWLTQKYQVSLFFVVVATSEDLYLSTKNLVRGPMVLAIEELANEQKLIPTIEGGHSKALTKALTKFPLHEIVKLQAAGNAMVMSTTQGQDQTFQFGQFVDVPAVVTRVASYVMPHVEGTYADVQDSETVEIQSLVFEVAADVAEQVVGFRVDMAGRRDLEWHELSPAFSFDTPHTTRLYQWLKENEWKRRENQKHSDNFVRRIDGKFSLVLTQSRDSGKETPDSLRGHTPRIGIRHRGVEKQWLMLNRFARKHVRAESPIVATRVTYVLGRDVPGFTDVPEHLQEYRYNETVSDWEDVLAQYEQAFALLESWATPEGFVRALTLKSEHTPEIVAEARLAADCVFGWDHWSDEFYAKHRHAISPLFVENLDAWLAENRSKITIEPRPIDPATPLVALEPPAWRMPSVDPTVLSLYGELLDERERAEFAFPGVYESAYDRNKPPRDVGVMVTDQRIVIGGTNPRTGKVIPLSYSDRRQPFAPTLVEHRIRSTLMKDLFVDVAYMDLLHLIDWEARAWNQLGYPGLGRLIARHDGTYRPEKEREGLPDFEVTFDGGLPQKVMSLAHTVVLEADVLRDSAWTAVVDKYLPLKNASWLSDGQSPLDEAEFRSRLKLHAVRVHSESRVEYTFDDDGMFGHHFISANSDDLGGSWHLNL